jgi:hypothetical protein
MFPSVADRAHSLCRLCRPCKQASLADSGLFGGRSSRSMPSFLEIPSSPGANRPSRSRSTQPAIRSAPAHSSNWGAVRAWNQSGSVSVRDAGSGLG